MAHEINNPNGSIRLANQYLARACKDALPLLQQIAAEEGDFNLGGLPFSLARGELVNCSATIERSTERIAQVIQDLRSYSLGARNEFVSDVDIKQVITGALTIVRSHGKYTGMTFSTDAAADIPSITGSQHQLEQVLINLLLNAVQATPGGKGQVTVQACFDRANDQVRISVKDEGGKSVVEWKGAFYRGFMNNDPPPELSDEAGVKAVSDIYKSGLAALKAKAEGK